MSLSYICKYYGVPAEKGRIVRLYIVSNNNYQIGVIVGSRGLFLKIKMDDGHERLCHPTWGIAYEGMVVDRDNVES